MNSIRNVSRLEKRLADAQADVADLESKLGKAETAWAQAVGKDDQRAESVARKALDAVMAELEAARRRIPLIETALREARINALPCAASLCGENLEKIGEQARKAAVALLEHYSKARVLAIEINAAYRQHRALIDDHKTLCHEWDSPFVPPRAHPFPVSIPDLNAHFKVDFDRRFHLHEGNLFAKPRAAQVEPEQEAVA